MPREICTCAGGAACAVGGGTQPLRENPHRACARPRPPRAASGACGADRRDLKEERLRRGPDFGVALRHLECDETEASVRRRGFGLRVDEDPDTPHRLGLARRQIEYEAQKRRRNAAALKGLIDRQTREPQHGEWVVGESPGNGSGEVVDLDAAGCDGSKAADPTIFYRNVGDSDVMGELVLARVAFEEPVEIKIPGAETLARVMWRESPNLHGSSAGEVPAWEEGGTPASKAISRPIFA